MTDTRPAPVGELIERLRAAIRQTEYKYFGDYEMSDGQRDAVDVLVEFAQSSIDALAASVLQPVLGEGESLTAQLDMRAKWQAVSDALDGIPGGMHADLEDAASAMWTAFDAQNLPQPTDFRDKEPKA